MFGGIDNRRENGEFKQRIPILMYHRIADDPAEGTRRYTVSPSVFAVQMGHLARSGHHVVGLDELIGHYASGVPLPKKAVAITFDDGYLDNYTHAYPVLTRYGFKATVFLVADVVGGKARWDAMLGDPVPDLMNWDHIEEMTRGGISFGAHTCTHPHLTQIPAEEARREIADSRKIIEENLQSEIRFFAYPYQEYNRLLREYVIESGYSAACSSISGWSDSDDDVFMLRRISIMECHDMSVFEWLVTVDDNEASLLRRLLKGKRSALRRRVAGLMSGRLS